MPSRNRRRAAAALVAAATLLAACEGADDDASARALDLVPANAALYFEMALDPSEEQDRALADLTGRLPASVAERAEDVLRSRVAALLSDAGVDLDDLEPSVEGTVAGFLVTEAIEDYWALLLEVREGRDEQAVATIADALSRTSEQTLGDLEYVSGRADDGTQVDAGMVDGFLVVGAGAGFEAAAETSASSSLATVPEFEEAVGAIAQDRLGMVYLNVLSLQNEATFEDRETREEFVAAGVFGNGVIAASLSARPDALVVEASSGFDRGGHFAPVLRGFEGRHSLGDVPGHAWVAGRVPKVKSAIRALVTVTGTHQKTGWRVFKRDLKRGGIRFGKDVLSWMREGTFYVGGHSPQTIDVGFVVRSARPSKSADFVRRMAFLLRRAGLRVTRLPSFARDADFDLHLPQLPGPLHVSGVGAFSLTYGRTLPEAYRAEGFLDDAGAFERARAALDDGYAPVLFARVPQAVGFVEGTVVSAGGLLSETYVDEVQPFLERGDYVMHGLAVEGDRILQQTVIGVR